jgi:hypothetical protein
MAVVVAVGTSKGPPWMCIEWMALVLDPMNRTFSWPTFMRTVSVAGYDLPLIMK